MNHKSRFHFKVDKLALNAAFKGYSAAFTTKVNRKDHRKTKRKTKLWLRVQQAEMTLPANISHDTTLKAVKCLLTM